MRRLLAGLVPLAVVCTGFLFAGRPASAQTAAPLVELRLASQSPWTGPHRSLELTVQATNTSAQTLDSLLVEVVVEGAARSRSVYDLSLTHQVTGTLLAFPFVQHGALAPGATRTFRVTQPLAALATFGENAIYPTQVQLWSRGAPVATLRTPVIFLIEHPKVPLELQWSWVLTETIQYDPAGVFRNGPLQSDVAPGGRLDTLLRILDGIRDPVDVPISPVLLDELTRMAAGYRLRAGGAIRAVPRGTGSAADAARALALLRDIARRSTTEVPTIAAANASLPALASGGLASTIPAMLDRGRTLVRTVTGRAPETSVLRPALSQLDAAAIRRLAALGTRTVLLDPGVLTAQAGLKLTPSPVTPLVARGGSVDAIAPDPALPAAARLHPTDPELAARAALGELASTWLELPGTPERGAAFIASERSSLGTAMLASFARLVSASPWLRPVAAAQFVGDVMHDARTSPPVARFATFAPSYVDAVQQTRVELEQFVQAAPGATALAAKLRDDLATATGGDFVHDQASGLDFVRAAHRAIESTYRHIELRSPVAFTLTSLRGFIPVTVENATGYPVRVSVRLVADRRLAFPAGNPRAVTLESGTGTFAFPVRAETTGRIPIKIQVLTPVAAGVSETIAESDTVVRSTVYNRVALVITVGAGVFLLLWWARRLLPGRRHP